MSGTIYAPISSSVGQKITGSIAKVLALGAADGEEVINRIEFGPFVEPESQFTASSIVTNITIPAGTVIEGPIARIHCSGGFLVYINE
jgi:hypothetical protein